MQLYVGSKSQNILLVSVEKHLTISSSYFPNFLDVFVANNFQQVSTDTPQVYRDPVLFMLNVQYAVQFMLNVQQF